jgi:glutathione S-transferase
VTVKVYGTPPSHPSHAARLMVEHKGIDHKMIWLLPGMHPALIRSRGFRGGTVPALKLDGKRVQHSREISRALDQFQPEPPLFPAEPSKRIAVEEAERWGEEILQPIPRRIYRYGAATQQRLRTQLARELGIPAAPVVAAVNLPVAKYMSRKAGGDPERVRKSVALLPPLIDHVESLLSEGTIGGKQLNAADFQIAPTVRVLMTLEDLEPFFEGRRAAKYALELMPEFPGRYGKFLPAEWLEPLRSS